MLSYRHIRHKRTIFTLDHCLSSAPIRPDNPIIFAQFAQAFTGLAQHLLIRCRGNLSVC